MLYVNGYFCKHIFFLTELRFLFFLLLLLLFSKEPKHQTYCVFIKFVLLVASPTNSIPQISQNHHHIRFIIIFNFYTAAF